MGIFTPANACAILHVYRPTLNETTSQVIFEFAMKPNYKLHKFHRCCFFLSGCYFKNIFQHNSHAFWNAALNSRQKHYFLLWSHIKSAAQWHSNNKKVTATSWYATGIWNWKQRETDFHHVTSRQRIILYDLLVRLQFSLSKWQSKTVSRLYKWDGQRWSKPKHCIHSDLNLKNAPAQSLIWESC